MGGVGEVDGGEGVGITVKVSFLFPVSNTLTAKFYLTRNKKIEHIVYQTNKLWGLLQFSKVIICMPFCPLLRFDFLNHLSSEHLPV